MKAIPTAIADVLVVDPVMVAKSGHRLLREDAVRAMPWPEYRRFRVRCRSSMCPACVSHPDPRLAAVCRSGACQVETR